MSNTVTLQVIADRVGVSKSTVSDVLRARKSKYKVSQATRDRIHQTVKELNYVPNAAARALVTGKTHSIGFLLSSRTNLGLANNYFASILSGVQAAAKEKGYSCVVNCYDMSSVKDFVMPSKVRKKIVDGIVISGRIEEDVLQMFVDSGLPFILVGESTDFTVDGILSVARDLPVDWISSFEYLAKLGHRKIAVGGLETSLGCVVFQKSIQAFREQHPEYDIEFSSYKSLNADTGIMNIAYQQGIEWAKSSERPTAVVGHDQWCVGFISAVLDSGFSCPGDISVISSCDTDLCRWFRPSITAMELPLYQGGKKAAEVLVDYIDRSITWMEANRLANQIWTNHELVIRDSTGPCANLKKQNIKGKTGAA
ncbi:Glucose-resistance amylase regulator [Limihaloglobus sulfuriphilus]|uniref:Glucose-resistance amylase regulator n=1 Tax=Limihaloglobus sulfuriphilus TaxID=1851148 RepID=A0A1R7T5T9_9BACT|nr:LacI family DNA-binding transcriptional regulator [Limihaloglobus sulfuriphilus]AQQ71763.1 Glucose-resistance amylase regulator [Limihaloglobus sulfuriphilus]